MTEFTKTAEYLAKHLYDTEYIGNYAYLPDVEGNGTIVRMEGLEGEIYVLTTEMQDDGEYAVVTEYAPGDYDLTEGMVNSWGFKFESEEDGCLKLINAFAQLD